jgi:hypothetical protein
MLNSSFNKHKRGLYSSLHLVTQACARKPRKAARCTRGTACQVGESACDDDIANTIL